jgi:hypothetical protein
MPVSTPAELVYWGVSPGSAKEDIVQHLNKKDRRFNSLEELGIAMSVEDQLAFHLTDNKVDTRRLGDLPATYGLEM